MIPKWSQYDPKMVPKWPAPYGVKRKKRKKNTLDGIGQVAPPAGAFSALFHGGGGHLVKNF